MIHVTITDETVELSPGGEVVLPNQSWADYEELLERRGDRAGVRVRYNARTKEIRLMTPLPRHGKLSDVISDLVKAVLRHQGRDWEAFDPITLRRQEAGGLEPDSCFYIGHSDAILGKDRIDLERDPPPDLAIEVDVATASSPDDYAPLRIPELWVYGNRALTIYRFDGQDYVESSESLAFPGIPVREVIPCFVERAWQVKASVALREFNQWLREHVPQ